MIMEKRFNRLSKVLGEMRDLIKDNGGVGEVFFDVAVDMEHVTYTYETRKEKSFIVYWAFTKEATVLNWTLKKFKDNLLCSKDWHCYEISYNCDSGMFVIEEVTFNK